ncbi:MAG: CoA transferase [Proteobacteria bacterium]|nr:CoA transferase [Pseudomonadota bacterium]
MQVTEWADGLAAPFAGKILAALGANVVKVEAATGERDRRSFGPFANGDADTGLVFQYVNAGKRSVTPDLSSEAGMAAFHMLLAQSNVLFLAKSQAILKEHGMDLPALRAKYPALVIVSVSPFGMLFPSADVPNTEMTLQHRSGFAFHSARPVSDPATQPPVSVADREGPLSTGLAAAVAALWGLAGVSRGAKSMIADVSSEAFYSHLLIEPLVEWFSGERDFERKPRDFTGTEIIGGLVWVLPSSDGWIMASPREQLQWERWVELIGAPAWAKDKELCGDRMQRKINWSKLQSLMSEWSKLHPKQEIFERAQEAKIACFPISEAADILANEQLLHRKFFDQMASKDGRAFRVPGLPFDGRKSDGTPFQRSRDIRCPHLGEDNDTILAPLMKAGAEATAPAELSPSQGPADPIAKKLPLQGIRVVDFSWILAGPLATKMLAAMGAEVIKIESGQRREYAQRGGYFKSVNANKKSITINIKDPDGQNIIRSLIEKSDIVVENFSATVLKRYGLSYDDLKTIKPDLIFCSASGVGRSGPFRDTLAYGTLLQGFSGRAALVGNINPQMEAMGVVPAWTDPVTAFWEAIAILSALHNKAKTGQGAFIDLSMLESTVTLLPESLLRCATGSNSDVPTGNNEPERAPSGCFPCSGEDQWIAVSVGTNAEWRALTRVMGRNDLAESERFAEADGRLTAKDELNSQLARWLAEKDAKVVERQLAEAGVPAAWSRNIADVVQQSGAGGAQLFPTLADGWRLAALPWCDDDGWVGNFQPRPELGQDNDYVLEELLGIDKMSIKELVEKNAIA